MSHRQLARRNVLSNVTLVVTKEWSKIRYAHIARYEIEDKAHHVTLFLGDYFETRKEEVGDEGGITDEEHVSKSSQVSRSR